MKGTRSHRYTTLLATLLATTAVVLYFSPIPGSEATTKDPVTDLPYIAPHIDHSLPSASAIQDFHPEITLLDRAGEPVAESQQPLSVNTTCGGECHDSAYIQANNDHAQHIASNCLLCHSDNYNAEAYFKTRQGKHAAWSASAPLIPLDLVKKGRRKWVWNETAAEPLAASQLGIQPTGSESCQQCHGIIHNSDEPLTIDLSQPTGRQTQKQGVIYSAQKLSDSALNIIGKTTLTRAFDVHAEHLLECSDCHRAANNPVHGVARESTPSHLRHDPRQPALSAFIKRPDHNLIIGAAGRADSEQSCQGCHAVDNSHDWLPEVKQHFAALACESCHIPELVGPAQQLIDNSVRGVDGEPVVQWRGQDVTGSDDGIITPYQPILLKRPQDGRFAPYNIALIRFWRDSADNTTLERDLVDAAWLESGLQPLQPGQSLSEVELKALRKALWELGVGKPELANSLETYPINHGVSGNDWALKACDACHDQESRLNNQLSLGAMHGDKVPKLTDNPLGLQFSQSTEQQLQIGTAEPVDLQLSWLDRLLLRFK